MTTEQTAFNEAHVMADHLVGNLYYNLDAVPVMAARYLLVNWAPVA